MGTPQSRTMDAHQKPLRNYSAALTKLQKTGLDSYDEAFLRALKGNQSAMHEVHRRGKHAIQALEPVQRENESLRAKIELLRAEMESHCHAVEHGRCTQDEFVTELLTRIQTLETECAQQHTRSPNPVDTHAHNVEIELHKEEIARLRTEAQEWNEELMNTANIIDMLKRELAMAHEAVRTMEENAPLSGTQTQVGSSTAQQGGFLDTVSTAVAAVPGFNHVSHLLGGRNVDTSSQRAPLDAQDLNTMPRAMQSAQQSSSPPPSSPRSNNEEDVQPQPTVASTDPFGVASEDDTPAPTCAGESPSLPQAEPCMQADLLGALQYAAKHKLKKVKHVRPPEKTELSPTVTIEAKLQQRRSVSQSASADIFDQKWDEDDEDDEDSIAVLEKKYTNRGSLLDGKWISAKDLDDKYDETKTPGQLAALVFGKKAHARVVLGYLDMDGSNNSFVTRTKNDKTRILDPGNDCKTAYNMRDNANIFLYKHEAVYKDA